MKTKIKNYVCGLAVLMLMMPIATHALASSTYTTPSAGLPSGSLKDIVTSIFNWMIGLIGLIAIIGFFLSAILYFTAAGDQDQIDRAKKAMINSIIGVIVALMGVVILTAVNAMLGGTGDF